MSNRILILNIIQHYLNPLHVYCRIIDLEINDSFAKRLCCFYEKNIYDVIKPKPKPESEIPHGK